MKSTPDQLLPEPIGRRLSKIGKLFLANLQVYLKHLDIERSFFPLLIIEAGNGLTQQELASQLNCDKVQVVRIIDYLSSNGYVKRSPNKTDKRKYELIITEKARIIIPDIQNAFSQTTFQALKGLSENQIKEFYSILSFIENNLITNNSKIVK
jgi:MarR family transcriptional regulator for hemolysin